MSSKAFAHEDSWIFLVGSYGLHVNPNGGPSKKVFVKEVLPTWLEKLWSHMCKLHWLTTCCPRTLLTCECLQEHMMMCLLWLSTFCLTTRRLSMLQLTYLKSLPPAMQPWLPNYGKFLIGFFTLIIFLLMWRTRGLICNLV